MFEGAMRRRIGRFDRSAPTLDVPISPVDSTAELDPRRLPMKQEEQASPEG